MSKRTIQAVFGIIVLTVAPVALDYSLAVAQTPIACDPEPTDMMINYGDTIECSLEVVGDSDLYRLQGTAGEVVVLQIADGNGSNPFPIVTVDVLDPVGGALISTTARATVTLPVTGTYTFVVSELQDDQVTGYNIAIERIAPAPSTGAMSICYGCTESGQIDPFGDMDIYSFDGSGGDLISVQISDGNGGNPFPVVQIDLYDPIGALVGSSASQVDTTLNATGTYTIVVYERDRDQPLSYNLTLQCFVGLCAPQPIPPVCDFQLSQTSYAVGETVTASVWRVANLSPDPVTFDFKNWIVTPTGTEISFIDKDDVTFPPGFDVDFGPLPLYVVTASFPDGQWQHNCRMSDTVTGADKSLDVNPFDVDNAGGP